PGGGTGAARAAAGNAAPSPAGRAVAPGRRPAAAPGAAEQGREGVAEGLNRGPLPLPRQTARAAARPPRLRGLPELQAVAAGRVHVPVCVLPAARAVGPCPPDVRPGSLPPRRLPPAPGAHLR